MENKSYYDINLLDTGLYNGRGYLYAILLNSGIKTVGQVLDDELMNRLKIHMRNPRVLDSFINFIKNKYESIPLPKTIFLEEKYINDKGIRDNTFGIYYNDRFPDRASCFGQMFEDLKKIGLVNDDTTFIEFYRLLLNDDLPLNNKVKYKDERLRLYVNDYDNLKLFEAKKHGENDIGYLKYQLSKLLEERKKLDIEIEKMQNIIDELSSEKTKGKNK